MSSRTCPPTTGGRNASRRPLRPSSSCPLLLRESDTGPDASARRPHPVGPGPASAGHAHEPGLDGNVRRIARWGGRSGRGGHRDRPHRLERGATPFHTEGLTVLSLPRPEWRPLSSRRPSSGVRDGRGPLLRAGASRAGDPSRLATRPNLAPVRNSRRNRVDFSSCHGVWRSLVARVVRDDEAAGSNPVTPTN